MCDEVVLVDIVVVLCSPSAVLLWALLVIELQSTPQGQ